MELIDLLPLDLLQSEECVEFQNAVNSSKDRLFDKIELLEEGLFIETAQDATLSMFEKVYNITNTSTDLDARRGQIKTKLRGTGTTTLQVIQDVCSTYAETEVTEDFSTYRIKIKFLNFDGSLAIMEQLKASLQEMIPAHLALSCIVSYGSWSEMKSANVSWGDLANNQMTYGDLSSEQP